jgi:phosphonate transport system substrate-binding protein
MGVYMKQCIGVFGSFLLLGAALAGCSGNQSELGSKDNPIKFFFLPSSDNDVINSKAQLVKVALEAQTGLHFKVAIPASYIAVVEAFGTKRADVATLNAFGYVLAHEKYGVEARLSGVRYGSDSYKAQIVARSTSDINKVSDLAGKKFAFVDPASTSGYLMPMQLFKDNNIKPKETVFANKHDSVITMVYQGRVDAGATFYTPPADGAIQDARRLVKTQFPDVESKVKIVALTDSIPNDPIVFRKDLPEAIKVKVMDALVAYIETPEGLKTMKELYGLTGLKVTTDQNYDVVRNMLVAQNKNADEFLKK